MTKRDLFNILGSFVIIVLLFHFFYFIAYFRVSNKKYIMKNGKSIFAFVYSKKRTRNSNNLLYKFVVRGDTIEGRMETRNNVNIGDSVLIMYSIQNPQKNLFIEDTAHTNSDMFFYNIYN